MVTASPIIKVDHTIKSGSPQFVDSRVRFLFNYWKSIFDEGDIPYKHDLNPSEFSKCLADMWLYRYIPEQDTFYCHLVGEEIALSWKHPMRNHNIGEIFSADEAEGLKKRWLHAINNRAFLYYRMVAPDTNQATERLALPMRDKEGKITYFLGISIYTYDKMKTRFFRPDFGTKFISYFSVDEL